MKRRRGGTASPPRNQHRASPVRAPGRRRSEWDRSEHRATPRGHRRRHYLRRGLLRPSAGKEHLRTPGSVPRRKARTGPAGTSTEGHARLRRRHLPGRPRPRARHRQRHRQPGTTPGRERGAAAANLRREWSNESASSLPPAGNRPQASSGASASSGARGSTSARSVRVACASRLLPIEADGRSSADSQRGALRRCPARPGPPTHAAGNPPGRLASSARRLDNRARVSAECSLHDFHSRRPLIGPGRGAVVLVGSMARSPSRLTWSIALRELGELKDLRATDGPAKLGRARKRPRVPS